MNITLSTIRMDGGTQSRAIINDETVADYAEQMTNGDVFPAITVYYDGADYWLSDGFHRVRAAQRAGFTEFAADVRQGSLDDARWHSYSVNQSHGLRRANEDKKRSVTAALQHPYASRHSNREIARHCGVSYQTVNNYRSDLSDKSCQMEDTTRIVTRNGKPYEMQTAGITAAHVTPRPTPTPTIHRVPVDDYLDTDDIPAVQIEDAPDTGDTSDNEPLTPYEQTIAARFVADDPPPDEPLPAAHPLLFPDRQPPALAVADSAPIPISQQAGYEGDEWYTPPQYVDAARAVMGRIDIDPASNDTAQQTIRALAYYTEADDGLLQEWFGNCWLNPPYSKPGKFVTKLIAEYDARRVKQAIILLNSSTDTSWFHELAARFPACFTRGRIGFLRADGKPIEGNRQGQVFFYLGANVARFCEVFGAIGTVVARSESERWEAAA